MRTLHVPLEDHEWRKINRLRLRVRRQLSNGTVRTMDETWKDCLLRLADQQHGDRQIIVEADAGT